VGSRRGLLRVDRAIEGHLDLEGARSNFHTVQVAQIAGERELPHARDAHDLRVRFDL
jgi:hypothetical protein